jgi:hypothetical protein
MIKYLFLLILFLGTGSLPAQKKKPPKKYENKVFSITIPKRWTKYSDLAKDKTVVFQMAPKSEINSRFYVESKESSSPVTREGKFSYVRLDISEEPLKYDNLEEYVQYRILRFSQRENKIDGESQKIYKESDDHYIEILKLKNIGTEVIMYHLMHVRSHKGKLYMMIFSSSEEKLEKYIDDAKQAFASFRFL